MDLVADYDNIRELMSQALSGFEDYNQRVRTEHGFALPNPPRDSRKFRHQMVKRDSLLTNYPTFL